MRSRRARAAASRYFEIAGVSEGVRDALSGRSREVWLAAERFRARYGRPPERDELRNVKLENRQAKIPQSRPELQAAWEQRAAARERRGGGDRALQAARPGGVQRSDELSWQERVAGSLRRSVRRSAIGSCARGSWSRVSGSWRRSVSACTRGSWSRRVRWSSSRVVE